MNLYENFKNNLKESIDEDNYVHAINGTNQQINNAQERIETVMNKLKSEGNYDLAYELNIALNDLNEINLFAFKK